MALNQNPSTVVNMKIAGKEIFFSQTNAKCWTCLNHPLKWSFYLVFQLRSRSQAPAHLRHRFFTNLKNLDVQSRLLVAPVAPVATAHPGWRDSMEYQRDIPRSQTNNIGDLWLSDSGVYMCIPWYTPKQHKTTIWWRTWCLTTGFWGTQFSNKPWNGDNDLDLHARAPDQELGWENLESIWKDPLATSPVAGVTMSL